jgi:protein TonB
MKIEALIIPAFFCIAIPAYSQKSENTNRGNTKKDSLVQSEFFLYRCDETQAEFPGGTTAWIKFLNKNLRSDIPIKNRAPNGTNKIIISFKVATNGKISNVKAETNFGYGMEQELIKVIQKGPKWIPATNSGKKINATRRQPVVFIVS